MILPKPPRAFRRRYPSDSMSQRFCQLTWAAEIGLVTVAEIRECTFIKSIAAMATSNNPYVRKKAREMALEALGDGLPG